MIHHRLVIKSFYDFIDYALATSVIMLTIKFWNYVI